MSGAPAFSIELSERKAYTSALVGMRTADIFPMVQPGQPLFPLMSQARYCAMGGGAPLTREGQVIAGVGVSGGTVEQDVAILEAGLREAYLMPVISFAFPSGGAVMLRQAKVAVTFVLVAFSLMMEGVPDACAGSTLPDAIKAGVAEKLFRLDCGRSLANDESVWTPGENVGRSIEFFSTCWLIKHGGEWLLWDTGVPESAHSDPRGWSTLPKLIVYHLDKTLTDQLAEIGLKPRDIARVAISHTHGDHIGNTGLFPNSMILMQRAEYSWISSPNGPNDNVNQLMALARELLGTPKNLQLVDGDTDIFADGSVTLVSTPGHTPGHQSLLVHLKNSGFIILSGDVVHLEESFEKNVVPSLNTNKQESLASMARIGQIIAMYKATLFINHDKMQADKLRLLPAFYD